MRLDELDQGLLRELWRDARQSHRALARRLGSTAPTVGTRIARLEALGLIRGYRADLAPGALEGEEWLVAIAAAPGRASAVQAAWAERPEATESFTLTEDRVFVRLRLPAGQGRRLLSSWAPGPDVVDWDAAPVLETRQDHAPAPASGEVAVACHHCGDPVRGREVRAVFSGRPHVFCCAGCREGFRARHAALRAGARP